MCVNGKLNSFVSSEETWKKYETVINYFHIWSSTVYYGNNLRVRMNNRDLIYLHYHTDSKPQSE